MPGSPGSNTAVELDVPQKRSPTSRRGVARGLVFLLLIGGSVCAGYYARRRSVPPPAPGLIPDKAVHQAGEIGQGETVHLAFALKNTYPAPVEIKSVTAGCSCQQTAVERRYLEPGDQTTVSVQWMVGSRRGPVFDAIMVLHTIPGPRGQVAEGRMALKIEANVAPDIEYSPKELKFEGGRPGIARITLAPGRQPRFKVLRTYSNSKAIVAVQDAQRREVEVRYTPTGELDFGTGVYIGVETDSKNEPHMRIPVSVVRVP
jgi:hypothetical protein